MVNNLSIPLLNDFFKYIKTYKKEKVIHIDDQLLKPTTFNSACIMKGLRLGAYCSDDVAIMSTDCFI